MALLAVLGLCGPAAAAGPMGSVDPPKHRLIVSLVERVSATASPLRLDMTYTPTQDYGAILIVGFQQRGRQRRLFDGAYTSYIEARRGGVYPSVAVDGRQQVPPCPALVLCSSPAIPGDYAIARFTPSPTPRLSYYVFANDVDVAYGVSEGWRRSEVSGADILQFRDSGTAARVSAAYRQYMVEDFHGVAASRVSRPSVAFASIPCWFPPLPGGSGKGVLVGGDGAGSHRRMDCATYWSVATGGSDRPTTWRVDGASLGWSGGFVNRLVVAVLPPG